MAAFGTYNNNQDNRPTSNTYTPISFTNPNSKIMDTRFNISYFNRVMCISIATRSNQGSNDYATYDNDNAIKVYVSFSQAKILHDAIVDMLTNGDKNNVCIELKNGLLMVSNGVEYGSPNVCISISYADKEGNVNTITYETKPTYEAAYNYSDGSFNPLNFPKFEIETIVMVLEEYYRASSYAVAATVKESLMYQNHFFSNSFKAIAEKVGAQIGNGGAPNKNSFNSKTFLSQQNNTTPTNISSGTSFNGEVPKEYEQSSFADIANGLMG